MIKHFLALPLLPVCLLASALASDVRTGTFTFSEWDGPSLIVHYVEPETADLAASPVVIVMHGVRRNADDYARNWADLAAEHGLRIYAPTFSKRDFRGAALYNLGGIGTEGPFAFAAIEPLFTAITQRGEADGYYLFGHSAGAQFVHRALLFEDVSRLKLAFAANAGWYTMPDEAAKWPYGLAGSPADVDDLRAWFAKPLIVLLGEEDNDPKARNLRRSFEALEQGPHRFARGASFLYAAQDKAKAIAVSLVWRGLTVPGVAHDNAGMARAAAPVIAQHAKATSGGAP